ncbi:MAG: EAL domain-containing protein [Salinibacter sp.]|uniref:putative bifunctional diguanylate cyclase/phosphodiesterase n=1 Tax=Salinibacter sp. TaxID=2065818 RepID=UPI002FC2E168
MSYPVPPNETERLDALRRLHVLDTDPEPAFDRLTEIASQIFDMPYAAVSLVTDQQQWRKAACGWNHGGAPRERSLCTHAVAAGELLVIEDLNHDDHFADHPLADESEPLQFYAGAPLTMDDDFHVGTLCVSDDRPRSFEAEDRTLLLMLAGTVVDLLRAHRQEQKMKSLASALEQANDAVLITEAEPLDPPGPRITWVNSACTDMTGYAPDELLGNTPRILQGSDTDPDVLAKVRSALKAEEPTRAETVNYRKDGTPYVVEWRVDPVHDDGTLTHWVSVQRDVTAQRRREEQLEHAATHDALTELLNRDALDHEVQSALDASTGAAGALLFMDLDRFKQVNDSLGHSAGDELLRAVATTVQEAVREDDVAARVGGDEFAIWLSGPLDRPTVLRVADRIVDAFERPFTIQGCTVYVEISIGVVPDTTDYELAEDVLRDGDTAMYRAKDAPEQSVVVHTPAMRQAAEEELILDTALHRAVENEEFVPYFHPLIRLQDGTLRGFEVLARWRRSDGEVMGPSAFLDAAVEAHLMTEIGHQVIESACRTLRRLQDQRGDPVVASLSGNFARAEFFRPETKQFVADLLERYDLAPDHFMMEITERTVVAPDARSQETIQALSDLGIRMEVDDFGTGFSSFHSLLRFPLDGLKLSRRITAALDEEPGGRVLIQSVLEVAEALDLTVTAEGIETPNQLSTVRDLGCTYGQGFLFTRPVPADALPDLLADPPWATHWST